MFYNHLLLIPVTLSNKYKFKFEIKTKGIAKLYLIVFE